MGQPVMYWASSWETSKASACDHVEAVGSTDMAILGTDTPPVSNSTRSSRR